jgi:hypothetical protein
MSRILLLASVALACAVTSSAADPACRQSYEAMTTFVAAIDSLGHDSINAALSCALHGPDDASFEPLKARYLKLFGSPPSDPPAGCIKNTLQELAAMITIASHAAGERFGIAFRQCTAKVQRRVAEMRRNGATDDEVGAEVGKMIQPIVDQLGK